MIGIIVIIIAFIVFIVMNIYVAPTDDKATPLTENEAKELAQDTFDGDIEEITRVEDQYEIIMKDDDKTVTVIVDDQTKQAVVQNNETATETKTDQTINAQQKLPLTKESAQTIAIDYFEGDIQEVILVEANGQSIYEITIAAEKEEAVLKIDQATGEVIEIMVSDSTTKNASFQSVANSTNQTKQSNAVTVQAPSTTILDEQAIKERVIRSIDGSIQSVAFTSANIYEVTVKQSSSTYIVKVNPYTGSIISKTKK
jgi:uncharacterized membrane protein YkoI